MGWRREGDNRPLMNAAPEKVEVSRRLQKGQISGKFKVRVPCAGQTGPPEPSAPHVTGVLILRTVMSRRRGCGHTVHASVRYGAHGALYLLAGHF